MWHRVFISINIGVRLLPCPGFVQQVLVPTPCECSNTWNVALPSQSSVCGERQVTRKSQCKVRKHNARRKHKVWSGHPSQTVGQLRKGIPENLQEARFRQHRWLRRGKVSGGKKSMYKKKRPWDKRRKKKKYVEQIARKQCRGKHRKIEGQRQIPLDAWTTLRNVSFY